MIELQEKEVAVGFDIQDVMPITPGKLNAEEEKDLIFKSQMGDLQAFNILVMTYQYKMFQIALSYLGNSDCAMDATQEAFMRALKWIETFNYKNRFSPWMSQIVRNHCLNILDKKRSDSKVISMNDEANCIPEAFVTGKDQQDKVEFEQLRGHIWDAIEQLSDKSREILVMAHFHEMPYKEIADILNIPTGTVMSRLFYARGEMKKILNESRPDLVELYGT